MKKTRIPLGSPADPPMDPPVWTTARCPPLHDLTPLLKTLLQFGLHLPLPACPFRMWVATFTPRFSFEDNYSSGKGADHTGQEESGLRPSTVAQRLPVFIRRELFKRKKWFPPPSGGGDWDLRTWPLLAHSRWGGGVWGVGDVWGGSASPAPLSGPNRNNFT